MRTDFVSPEFGQSHHIADFRAIFSNFEESCLGILMEDPVDISNFSLPKTQNEVMGIMSLIAVKLFGQITALTKFVQSFMIISGETQ